MKENFDIMKYIEMDTIPLEVIRKEAVKLTTDDLSAEDIVKLHSLLEKLERHEVLEKLERVERAKMLKEIKELEELSKGL